MPAPRSNFGKSVDPVRALLDAMAHYAQGAGEIAASADPVLSGTPRPSGDPQPPIEGFAVRPSDGDKPRKRFPTRRARRQPRRKEHAPEHAARRIAIERATQRFSKDARYFGFRPPAVPMARSRRSTFVGMLRLLVMPVVLFAWWWLAARGVAAVFGQTSRVLADLIGLWIAGSATILADALLVASAKVLFARRRRRVS